MAKRAQRFKEILPKSQNAKLSVDGLMKKLRQPSANFTYVFNQTRDRCKDWYLFTLGIVAEQEVVGCTESIDSVLFEIRCIALSDMFRIIDCLISKKCLGRIGHVMSSVASRLQS